MHALASSFLYVWTYFSHSFRIMHDTVTKKDAYNICDSIRGCPWTMHIFLTYVVISLRFFHFWVVHYFWELMYCSFVDSLETEHY